MARKGWLGIAFIGSVTVACQLQKPAPQVTLQATLPSAEEQCAEGEVLRVFVPRPDADMEPRKWMTYIQMHFGLTALTTVDLVLDPDYRDDDANTALPQGQVFVPCASIWGPARPALRAWAEQSRYIDGLSDSFMAFDVLKRIRKFPIFCHEGNESALFCLEFFRERNGWQFRHDYS